MALGGKDVLATLRQVMIFRQLDTPSNDFLQNQNTITPRQEGSPNSTSAPSTLCMNLFVERRFNVRKDQYQMFDLRALRVNSLCFI